MGMLVRVAGFVCIVQQLHAELESPGNYHAGVHSGNISFVWVEDETTGNSGFVLRASPYNSQCGNLSSASSQLTSVMLKGGLYGVDIKAANIPVSQDSVVLAPHETYTKYFDIANLDEPGCGRGFFICVRWVLSTLRCSGDIREGCLAQGTCCV